MAGLFLPFTLKAKAIEIKAIGIKERHGIGPYEAIDPVDLAAKMEVEIIPATWVDTLDPELRRQLIDEIGHTWSAGSLVVDGRTYVLLNPGHSAERHSPTLAEELVHVALGHAKSRLITVDGVPIRTCEHDVESEAYAVAVALILPYRTVFYHIRAGEPVETIPSPVPLSTECRAYRTKVSGMWPTAVARLRARQARSANTVNG
jgi:Zn-dependent peptidase ImmA (M78 family)